MVRQGFAIGRAAEHEQIIAALLEACALCDQARNWPLLAEILCRPQYVDAPADCFLSSGNSPNALPGLDIFHRFEANVPTGEKACWIMEVLYQLLEKHSLDWRRSHPAPVLKNIFRRDSFDRAQALLSGHHKHEQTPETKPAPLLA